MSFAHLFFSSFWTLTRFPIIQNYLKNPWLKQKSTIIKLLTRVDDTNSNNFIKLIENNDSKVYKSIVLIIYSNSSTLRGKKNHFNYSQQRIASFKCHKLFILRFLKLSFYFWKKKKITTMEFMQPGHIIYFCVYFLIVLAKCRKQKRR